MQEIQCGLESRPCAGKMERSDKEPDGSTSHKQQQ